MNICYLHILRLVKEAVLQMNDHAVGWFQSEHGITCLGSFGNYNFYRVEVGHVRDEIRLTISPLSMCYDDEGKEVEYLSFPYAIDYHTFLHFDNIEAIIREISARIDQVEREHKIGVRKRQETARFYAQRRADEREIELAMFGGRVAGYPVFIDWEEEYL